MNLRMATNADYKAIKALYVSSFPRNERAPFFVIKGRAAQGRATMLVAEEGGEFIGFAYTIAHDELVYLFYFAVAEGKRCGGNGSEILRLLKLHYVGKHIFLGREQLDSNAKNNQQRIRRHSFYIRNGFIDLPYHVKEAGVVYDLMGTGGAITPSSYTELIKSWAGAFVLHLVKMEFFE